MFCVKCGTPLRDVAQFCPQCGTPVTAAPPPMPSAAVRSMSLNQLFQLFHSPIVTALMVLQIIALVLIVLAFVLSVRLVFTGLFGILLVAVIALAGVSSCFQVAGLRTARRATFVEEARRACHLIRRGLYFGIGASLLAMLTMLMSLFVAFLYVEPFLQVTGDSLVMVTSGPSWGGVVLGIALIIVSYAPTLLVAEVLRRCQYDLWLLSEPTVSLRFVKVGGLVTTIVLAVSVVVDVIFSGISIALLVSAAVRVMTAVLAFQFYKIVRSARSAAPEA